MKKSRLKLSQQSTDSDNSPNSMHRHTVYDLRLGLSDCDYSATMPVGRLLCNLNSNTASCVALAWSLINGRGHQRSNAADGNGMQHQHSSLSCCKTPQALSPPFFWPPNRKNRLPSQAELIQWEREDRRCLGASFKFKAPSYRLLDLKPSLKEWICSFLQH